MQATQSMPPMRTQNTLDAEQRLRLVRSARKLGAVLGASTILLDHDTDMGRRSTSSSRSPSPKARLPIGPGYKTNLSNSSAASLASTSSVKSSSSLPTPTSATPLSIKPSASFADLSEASVALPFTYTSKSKRSRARPPPLILSTRIVNVSADDRRAQQQSERTPTLENGVANVTYPLTPRTPFSPLKTPPPPPTRLEKRQRMARKVAKHLGEPVPPSLIVLPPTPVAIPPQVPVTIKALPPVLPLPASVSSTKKTVRVDQTQPTACKLVWEGEWNRERQDVLHNLRMLKAVR